MIYMIYYVCLHLARRAMPLLWFGLRYGKLA